MLGLAPNNAAGDTRIKDSRPPSARINSPVRGRLQILIHDAQSREASPAEYTTTSEVAIRDLETADAEA